MYSASVTCSDVYINNQMFFKGNKVDINVQLNKRPKNKWLGNLSGET